MIYRLIKLYIPEMFMEYFKFTFQSEYIHSSEEEQKKQFSSYFILHSRTIHHNLCQTKYDMRH